MAELCHESDMVCFMYRDNIAHSTIKPLAKATVSQMCSHAIFSLLRYNGSYSLLALP